MSAKILQFTPLLKNKVEKIPLYNEEQITVLFICVNTFFEEKTKYGADDISTVEPSTALKCLKSALEADIFSDRFRSIVQEIINNAVIE